MISIQERSYAFSLSIVKLAFKIQKEKKEFVISKQILKSGSSVGANLREAQNAVSRADYKNKFAIAQKECNETLYWLEIMKDCELIDKQEFNLFFKKGTELHKILSASIVKLKT